MCHAVTTVASPMALYEQLNRCNSLVDPVVYSKDTLQVTLASDPKGYCLLTIKKDEKTAPINCSLSVDDVKIMTSPEAQKMASKVQNTNLKEIDPAEVLTYFYPLTSCIGTVMSVPSTLTLPTTPP